jgi:hypothetical protein
LNTSVALTREVLHNPKISYPQMCTTAITCGKLLRFPTS